jgi:hypothetical protein
VDPLDARTDGLELSLKLYHGSELLWGYQHLMTEAPEFAALVSSNLKHISFENKQKLLRMTLDSVVVDDWRVDVYYNIPLPKPNPEGKVSTNTNALNKVTNRLTHATIEA